MAVKLKIGTGVNKGAEFWRITSDANDLIGAYPKKKYSKDEAKAAYMKELKATKKVVEPVTGGNGHSKKEPGNVVSINAADFKFAAFTNLVIQRTPDSEKNTDWFVQLRELDAKIHASSKQTDITFADDRLIMAAYKIMCNGDAFNSKPGLREWWIVNRYLEIYAAKNTPMLSELRKVVNMYIGFTFSKAKMNDDQKKEIKDDLAKLSAVVYEDGYIELPEFVLEVIDENRMTSKPKSVYYDFSDETDQWQGMKDLAELMLSEKELLTPEEVKLWTAAYASAQISLGE